MVALFLYCWFYTVSIIGFSLFLFIFPIFVFTLLLHLVFLGIRADNIHNNIPFLFLQLLLSVFIFIFPDTFARRLVVIQLLFVFAALFLFLGPLVMPIVLAGHVHTFHMQSYRNDVDEDKTDNGAVELDENFR